METLLVFILGAVLGCVVTLAGAALFRRWKREPSAGWLDAPPTRNDVPPSPVELAFLHPHDRPARSVEQYELWQTLTARENQVALLVARGLANAEVAAALGISPRTVDAYLRNVYGKLDVHTRTALANFVRDLEA